MNILMENHNEKKKIVVKYMVSKDRLPVNELHQHAYGA